MKYYKCVKAWQRHGLGTMINEWEYTKLPINIKSGYFQEMVVSDGATANAVLENLPISTIWTEGSKSIDLNVPPDTEVTISSNVTNYTTAKTTGISSTAVQPNAPLTTFSSGNKFKDKHKSPNGEDDIRPTE